MILSAYIATHFPVFLYMGQILGVLPKNEFWEINKASNIQ